MSGNDSGPPSSSGGPSGSAAPLTEATARRLVLALELLARRLGLGGDAAAAFANRDRAVAGQPHPAMTAMMAAAAAGPVANAAAGRASPVESAPASSQPAKVEVVKWSAALPGAKQIGGGVQDADYRVLGGPKALPGSPGAPIPPKEYTPWQGTGAWNLKRPNIDFDAMWAQLGKHGVKRPEPPADPKPKGEGEGVAKALAAQFGRVLAPLMAFSTILNASNSGMGTFQKAVNVLATSLAPILLPPMILLSAAILTVSDVIWTKVRPHLAMWAELITSTFVPAIEEAVDNLANLADAIEWVVDHVPGLKKSAPPAPGGEGATAGKVAGAVGQGMLDATVPGLGILKNPGAAFRAITNPLSVFGLGGRREAESGSAAPGQQGAPPAAPRTAGDRLRASVAESRVARAPTPPGAAGGAGGSSFGGNLDMVLASLTKSLGPKAEYTTAAGAARARQIAGANGDPLDMRALLRAIESVREVNAGVKTAVERLNQPTPQAPPSGGNR